MTSRTLFFLTLAVALIGAVAPQVQAQPKPARLLAAGSEIAFTTRQMGVPEEGKLGKFSAQVVLDPRQPETGSVSLGIDTGSARFGSAELDAEVPKATWLNVPRFAQATFQPSGSKGAGAGKFEVAGKLSIKRLEFKVGEDEWADTSMLANDIQVRFKPVLAGLGPL